MQRPVFLKQDNRPQSLEVSEDYVAEVEKTMYQSAGGLIQKELDYRQSN
jgi:hypothetical protein